MASRSTPQGDSHFSFAKIAAMPAPSNPQSSSVADVSDSAQPGRSPNYSESLDTGAQLSDNHHLHTIEPEASPNDPLVDSLGRAVQDIDIGLRKDRHESTSSLDGQESGILKRDNFFDDDRTHLSSSSTKMTNFDSKSLASVTTFAMDEKDSVRPDDSASVQAIDEEESLSGPASGAPNSVTGSEAGGRAFRDHFRDGNPQRPRGIISVPGPLFSGGNQRGVVAIPPDSVSNNFVVPAHPGGLQDGQSIHGYPLEPDEKLLEAMKSPKDRLLILQLEEKIRCFIRDDGEQSLELPPSNAFGRLLAHRLGDYYHLTHFVDNNVTSVRLHRTPFCRLPTPLSEIHAANNTTPPPAVPAMKIMRRNDGERPSTEGSIAASSSVPSKAPSEAGDGQDSGSSGGTPSKDRINLTREEREAKYNQARERIFRDFPDSAKSDPASGDSNPDVSRSSSTTGRKKNNQKQRTPQDDGFEARSQFNAYYPGAPFSNSSAQFPGGSGTVGDGSFNGQVPFLVGPGVPLPRNGYVPSSGNNAMYNGGNMNMNNIPQYPMTVSPQMPTNGPWQGGNVPQQSPYPGYTSMNQTGIISQQPSTKSSPAMNNFAVPQSGPYQQDSGWNHQAYPANYQRNQNPVHWPNYPSSQTMPSSMASYPYAQYPGQHLNSTLQNPNGPAMSGNMVRSHFNPQTRSFVPGAPPPARHPMKGVQLPQYSGVTPSVPNQWTGYMDPTNNRNLDYNTLPRISNSNTRDSIAKWGTPSHLPPKPPPSEVPSEFDLKHRAGTSAMTATSPYTNGIVGTKNGPLVVSGGNGASKPN